MKDQTTSGQPQLNKSLGLVTVLLLVISSIIGSGVFKKVAPMSSDLGVPTLVLISWGLAGLVTLMGALTNAEVAGMIAESGGQYAYFKKMYGRGFAFTYGWASFAVIQCGTTASVAYVFAQSINSIHPLTIALPDGWSTWSVLGSSSWLTNHLPWLVNNIKIMPFDNFGVKLVTMALIAVLTIINYRGVKYGGMLTNVFASTVVVCIFAIIVLGLFFGHGSMENFHQHINGKIFKDGDSTLTMLKAIFAGMIGAFWAYEGWNSVGFVGGEMKNPKRDLPLALIGGVLFVITTYLLINFTYLYVTPISEIVDTFHKDENSIAAVAVVTKILGSWGGLLVSGLIIIATFNCTNSQILTAPRIYYAMAKDKLFFSKAADVHPEFKTPHWSLVVSGIWACVLVLSGSFDQLTDMLVFAAFLFYGSGAIGVFVLRKKMPDAPRPYKVIGYPVIPALFIIFCITLIVVTIHDHPVRTGIGLALIASGLPFYFYWNKKNGTQVDTTTTEA